LSTTLKFGRHPRTFDPGIPHLSSVLAGKEKLPLPAAVDHTKTAKSQLPAELGMMLNNKLQNCTCAAYYHGRQVWTFQTTGSLDTEPDSNVELLYELACGYKPSQAGEGPGGGAQQVLKFLHKEGAPVGPGGKKREKIGAFLEVDPRNTDDVKRTIVDCGIAYVGLSVPQNVIPATHAPPAIWTVDPNKPKIVENHVVVLTGYDDAGFTMISWGRVFRMTEEFFAKYVDEVYAIADPAWITAKNRTPGGLSLAQLEEQMRYL
jgi:hypothetical protein